MKSGGTAGGGGSSNSGAQAFFLSLAYGLVQMKVEALIAGVWEGQTRLRAKGAEKALFAGRSTVMALVGKLADEMQSRWFTY